MPVRPAISYPKVSRKVHPRNMFVRSRSVRTQELFLPTSQEWMMMRRERVCLLSNTICLSVSLSLLSRCCYINKVSVYEGRERWMGNGIVRSLHSFFLRFRNHTLLYLFEPYTYIILNKV